MINLFVTLFLICHSFKNLIGSAVYHAITLGEKEAEQVVPTIQSFLSDDSSKEREKAIEESEL